MCWCLIRVITQPALFSRRPRSLRRCGCSEIVSCSNLGVYSVVGNRVVGQPGVGGGFSVVAQGFGSLVAASVYNIHGTILIELSPRHDFLIQPLLQSVVQFVDFLEVHEVVLDLDSKRNSQTFGRGTQCGPSQQISPHDSKAAFDQQHQDTLKYLKIKEKLGISSGQDPSTMRAVGETQKTNSTINSNQGGGRPSHHVTPIVDTRKQRNFLESDQLPTASFNNDNEIDNTGDDPIDIGKCDDWKRNPYADLEMDQLTEGEESLGIDRGEQRVITDVSDLPLEPHGHEFFNGAQIDDDRIHIMHQSQDCAQIGTENMNPMDSGIEVTQVYCWGDNSFGQLGLGSFRVETKTDEDDSSSRSEPSKLIKMPQNCSFNIGIQKMACGQEHSAFITTSGLLYSMGCNNFGQLGIGDPMIQLKASPILVEKFVGLQVTDVACGDHHTIALIVGYQPAEYLSPTSEEGKDDGGFNSSFERGATVFAWGSNQSGQLGVGISMNQPIRYEPELVNFESYFKPSIGLIQCGSKHSAFVDDIGRLFTCGANELGACAGSKSDKIISTPIHVSSISDQVTQVACGTAHTLALTIKGRIYGFGSNQSGQLGLGKKIKTQFKPAELEELAFTSVVELRTGSFSSALSFDHQFYVWGRGVFGTFFNPHRIKSFSQLDIKDFQISRGGSSYVLTRKGTLYAWGDNSFGQLGLGDFDIRQKPTKISSINRRPVSSLSLGNNYVIALGETLIAASSSRELDNSGPQPQLSAHKVDTANSVVLRKNSSELISIDQLSSSHNGFSNQKGLGGASDKPIIIGVGQTNHKISTSTQQGVPSSKKGRTKSGTKKTKKKSLASKQAQNRQKSLQNLNEGMRNLAKLASKKGRLPEAGDSYLTQSQKEDTTNYTQQMKIKPSQDLLPADDDGLMDEPIAHPNADLNLDQSSIDNRMMQRLSGNISNNTNTTTESKFKRVNPNSRSASADHQSVDIMGRPYQQLRLKDHLSQVAQSRDRSEEVSAIADRPKSQAYTPEDSATPVGEHVSRNQPSGKHDMSLRPLQASQDLIAKIPRPTESLPKPEVTTNTNKLVQYQSNQELKKVGSKFMTAQNQGSNSVIINSEMTTALNSGIKNTLIIRSGAGDASSSQMQQNSLCALRVKNPGASNQISNFPSATGAKQTIPNHPQGGNVQEFLIEQPSLENLENSQRSQRGDLQGQPQGIHYRNDSNQVQVLQTHQLEEKKSMEAASAEKPESVPMIEARSTIERSQTFKDPPNNTLNTFNAYSHREDLSDQARKPSSRSSRSGGNRRNKKKNPDEVKTQRLYQGRAPVANDEIQSSIVQEEKRDVTSETAAAAEHDVRRQSLSSNYRSKHAQQYEAEQIRLKNQQVQYHDGRSDARSNDRGFYDHRNLEDDRRHEGRYRQEEEPRSFERSHHQRSHHERSHHDRSHHDRSHHGKSFDDRREPRHFEGPSATKQERSPIPEHRRDILTRQEDSRELASKNKDLNEQAYNSKYAQYCLDRKKYTQFKDTSASGRKQSVEDEKVRYKTPNERAMPEIYARDNLLRDNSVDEVGYQSRYEELVKKYGLRGGGHREASTETEKPGSKWRRGEHKNSGAAAANETSPLHSKHLSRSTDVYHRHSFGHGQLPTDGQHHHGRSSQNMRDSEESRLKSADRRTEARASYFRSDAVPAGKSETQKVRDKLQDWKEKSQVFSPAKQLQQLVETLLEEKENLLQEIEKQRMSKEHLESSCDKLKDELRRQDDHKTQELLKVSEQNTLLEQDLERFKRMVFELEDRVEQHKAVKDSLRRKLKETEEVYVDCSMKKDKLARECREYKDEANMFREDVAYLTTETEHLLDELKAEQDLRQAKEEVIRSLQADFKLKQEQLDRKTIAQADEIRVLNSKIDKLMRDLDSGAKAHAILQNEKEEAVLRFNNLDADFFEARNQLLSQQQKVEELQLKVEKGKTQNEVLTHDNEQLRKNIDSLLNSQGQMQIKIHDHMQAEKKLQVQLAGEQDKIENLQGQIKNHLMNLEEVNELNNRLQQRLDQEIVTRAKLYKNSTMNIINGSSNKRAKSLSNYREAASNSGLTNNPIPYHAVDTQIRAAYDFRTATAPQAPGPSREESGLSYNSDQAPAHLRCKAQKTLNASTFVLNTTDQASTKDLNPQKDSLENPPKDISSASNPYDQTQYSSYQQPPRRNSSPLKQSPIRSNSTSIPPEVHSNYLQQQLLMNPSLPVFERQPTPSVGSTYQHLRTGQIQAHPAAINFRNQQTGPQQDKEQMMGEGLLSTTQKDGVTPGSISALYPTSTKKVNELMLIENNRMGSMSRPPLDQISTIVASQARNNLDTTQLHGGDSTFINHHDLTNDYGPQQQAGNPHNTIFSSVTGPGLVSTDRASKLRDSEQRIASLFAAGDIQKRNDFYRRFSSQDTNGGEQGLPQTDPVDQKRYSLRDLNPQQRQILTRNMNVQSFGAVGVGSTSPMDMTVGYLGKKAGASNLQSFDSNAIQLQKINECSIETAFENEQRRNPPADSVQKKRSISASPAAAGRKEESIVPPEQQHPLRQKSTPNESRISYPSYPVLSQRREKRSRRDAYSSEGTQQPTGLGSGLPQQSSRSSSKAVDFNTLIRQRYEREREARSKSGEPEKKSPPRIPPSKHEDPPGRMEALDSNPPGLSKSESAMTTKLVKDSLADLKVRLSLMRKERGQANQLKNELKDYEERKQRLGAILSQGSFKQF